MKLTVRTNRDAFARSFRRSAAIDCKAPIVSPDEFIHDSSGEAPIVVDITVDVKSNVDCLISHGPENIVSKLNEG